MTDLRPAPVWDEDAEFEAVDAARIAVRMALADAPEAPADVIAAHASRAILAVVRRHLPVKPSREDVARALYEHVRPGRDAWDRLPYKDDWRAQADAVLAILPGRSEAEVAAKSWIEGYRVRKRLLQMDDDRKPLDVWLRFPTPDAEEPTYEANTFLVDGKYVVEWYHVDVGLVTRVEFDSISDAYAWYAERGYEDYSAGEVDG